MDSPIVWILLGLLIVGLVVIVLYVTSDNPIDLDNSTNVSLNFSYFTFYVESNNVDTINYKLDNGSSVLMQGLLFPSIVEEYTPMVVNGSILNLSVWSDNYYYNVSVCNISVNQSHCRTNAFRKANGYSIELYYDSLFFDLVEDNTVVQSPTVCFFWDSNVLNVLTPFNRVDIPDDLIFNVSICYLFNTVFNDSSFPIDVHYRDTENGVGNLTVYVDDFEISGLNNIGLRKDLIMVQKQ